jgi:hypothetical protein
LCNSFVPTLDDLAGSKDKLKLFVPVSGAIELFAVGEGAVVVDAHLAALRRFLAIAFLDDLSLHLKYLKS